MTSRQTVFTKGATLPSQTFQSSKLHRDGTPHQVYEARHALLTEDTAANRRSALRLRITLLSSLALAMALTLFSFRSALSCWPVADASAGFLVALFFYFRNRSRHVVLTRLLTLYDRALARTGGSVPQSGHTGEQFRTPGHLYDRDLTILGPDSLFGLLATVRTGVGQRGLARDLLEPHTREATLARQTAIQELASRLDLRESIYLLGSYDFHQVPATFFDGWLDEPAVTFHPVVRPTLVLTSSLLMAGLIAGLWHLLSWSTLMPNLLLVFATQCALGLYLRSRVLPILNGAAHLSNQMRMFEDGIALLQQTALQSPHLVALQQRSLHPHSAVTALKQVQSQFVIVEQRTKEWFLVASLLTNAGTHAALSIAAWKRQHAAAMKLWLVTWAEFESLNALATYAFEHPDTTYPAILPAGSATFEATALAHPLLGPEAVPNDIALSRESSAEQATRQALEEDARTASLYLISGSNMAGKSTLLRSIGLNAVLAAAGAPIRATRARISPLALGASLALTDSLAEGKSKFLAEVERLHAILQLASQTTPVLFLIDEIFSGTNSLDRRVAAEAVAGALVARNAIGALSTHDLTLTAMAANPALYAVNLHMASPDPADPLAFDYRLKPGVNPTSNALAILRLLGIETAPDEARPPTPPA